MYTTNNTVPLLTSPTTSTTNTTTADKNHCKLFGLWVE